MQNPWPRQPNLYERYILHMPRHHLRWCSSTSNNTRYQVCFLFPFGRSVRSSQTRKRGATLLLPLPRYLVPGMLFFSGCTASIHATNNIPFGSFQCSLGGGKERTKTVQDLCQWKRKVSIKSLISKDTRQNFLGTACYEYDSSKRKLQTSGKPQKLQLWGRCWAKINFRGVQGNVWFEAARFRVRGRHRSTKPSTAL